jgi:PPP family 3-phenylpropionic acid transporter
MSTEQPPLAPPALYGQRIALFYAGYFILSGVALPFFPVWLAARGLTAAEIASCVALPIALRVLLTPLAGIFADRAPNRRFAARTFGIASFLIFLLAWPAEGYWPILITTGAAMVLYQVTLPVADALALTGVRQFGLDFGRMRFSGSVTFIVTNLGAGLLLGVVAPGSIYFMMLGGFVAVILVGLTLPVTPRAARALDDAGRPQSRSPRAILGNPILVAALAASALVQASHGVAYSFASLYWQGRGFSGVEIGSFWAIGVICEIMLFLWSGAVVRKIGDIELVLVGALAAILRWGLFPLDLGVFGTLLIQCLHGLTFGATYLGTQHTIARFVPEQMTASATGFYSMATGISMAAITALSGPFYEALGPLAFATMMLPPVISVAILVLLKRGKGPFSPKAPVAGA